MKRPLSPHLQIYKPQLTSVLSILHRITGVVFLMGLFLVCAWIYALSEGEASHSYFCQWFSQPLFKIFLFSILASSYYHLLNGIRYLFWSLGKGFDLKNIYYSGWAVCFLALISTIITALLI
ncbi:MAG: succinate dehydrogenase, cytochrome b556 subunit [Pseudomonadota bacterium]|jgi:succinate dehydrogenase / fumarate reductase cytochrome b subunit